MSKITVIYHSADYDGVFCREIARIFLPGAELIGWDFKDGPMQFPEADEVYVLDLPIKRLFTPDTLPIAYEDIIWIDHHKSSIEEASANIFGYRIDGVAACRLTWQWFMLRDKHINQLPKKEDYINRQVLEPLAVRLAGEYDVWDLRGEGELEFQFGLDASIENERLDWDYILTIGDTKRYIDDLLKEGGAAMACIAKRDADIVRERSFLAEFEGLVFLCLNTARCNSQTFKVRDVPKTGHEALMAFYWNGKRWLISMYHASHRKDLDLSKIAIKYGGGGHKGACGFSTLLRLPFIP